MQAPFTGNKAETRKNSISKTPNEQWELKIAQTGQSALSTTAIHLRTLGLRPSRDGYRFLEVAIPLYAEDPSLRLHKEIYPAVAEICEANDETCVEHAIRTAIKSAWKGRDITLWKQYFPLNDEGDIDCPSNKLFIATLAEML